MTTTTHAFRRLLLSLSLVLPAPALLADVTDCLKVVPGAGGSAAFSNVCIDWVNVMYCIEGGQGATACASKPKDVYSLVTGASVPVEGYAGASSLHWAACMYPEAPVGWDPGPDRPYTCKKTCVMC